MQKRHRSITELRDTRVKTTFKVEVVLDIPYLDNKEYANTRLREVMEEILSRISKNDIDGHIDTEDSWQMGHKMEAFYGIEEEEEYNIHDWDI